MVTVRANVSLIETLAASVAVTLMLIVPTSPFSGVPEKLPVVASKLSQAGSGEPSSSVAVRVGVSPASGSTNVPAGRVNEKAPSSLMV